MTPSLSKPSDLTQIILSLVLHIRVTTTHALGAFYWPSSQNPERLARQWVYRQVERGLLSSCLTCTKPEVDVSHPLLYWRPGELSPNFDTIAYQAKRRFSVHPERRYLVTSTTLARRLYGAGGEPRSIRTRETHHDIALASVFWGLLRQDPELPNRWQSEDGKRTNPPGIGDDVIPDAVIRGEPDTIVEFVGAYSAKKLRRLHEAYSPSPYMFW